MMRWSFTFPWLTVVLGLGLLAVAARLALLQWQRTGARRGVLALEALRWLIVLLLFLTLMQPEARLRRARSASPEVVVLRDASRSMTTRDVPVSAGGAVSREAWVREQLESDVWSSLARRYAIRVSDFSPPPTNSPVATAGEGTDINAALETALDESRDVRAVVLFSDGDWNAGRAPASAATRLRAAGIPVYAVGAGSDRHLPDIELAPVSAPAYGLLGEQLFIPFTVRSHLDRDVETSLALADASGTLTTKKLRIPAGAEVQDAVLWYPQKEGEALLSLRLPPERDELREDNNTRAFQVAVRRETLRVLVVDSLPRWEYRFLRNALSRDPMVELRCVLLHPELPPSQGPAYLPRFPATRDELSAFDVVFLGDVGVGDGELTAANAELLRGLVEQQGSGLVLVPGRRGRQLALRGTALDDLCPVVLDRTKPLGIGAASPSPLSLTRQGRSHLLTMLANNEEANAMLWPQLPGFSWCAGVEKAKAGATVLAVHDSLRNASGKLPLLVTRAAGNGKVLFLGTDSAWRWRCGVEDVYHYRFWGQVVRWMSYQRHRAQNEGFRLSFTPDTPAEGEQVHIAATVFDAGGMPVSDARVTADVLDAAGRTERLALSGVGGGWGVYAGGFVPRRSGPMKVRLACEETGRQLETEILVSGLVREEVGRPAATEVLREIAAITGGTYTTPGELPKLVSALATMPERPAEERRLRLWCHPAWGAMILALLVVYWTGRKLVGLI